MIDYLKIDVENSDLRVLEDIVLNSPNLLKNVKMFAAEVHPQFFYGIFFTVLFNFRVSG